MIFVDKVQYSDSYGSCIKGDDKESFYSIKFVNMEPSDDGLLIAWGLELI